MRSESEREEDHDSFTPCRKDLPPPIPEKPELFLCRAGAVAIEAVLNEEAPTFNKSNWNLSLIPTDRDRETTAGQCAACLRLCLSSALHRWWNTAENAEHTLVRFNGVNNKINISGAMLVLKTTTKRRSVALTS